VVHAGLCFPNLQRGELMQGPGSQTTTHESTHK
jgi:hypothetical protein